MKICREEGCGKPVQTRGWCSAHYSRVIRYGDVNFRQRRGNGEGSFRGRGPRMWFTRPDGKRVQEAVLIVEKVLGRTLPQYAIVHHINEDETDNRNENLVACESQGLHNIIHGRTKALKACGNARWKPCRYCHEYDDPAQLVKNGTSHYHQVCNTNYYRRARNRLQRNQEVVR